MTKGSNGVKIPTLDCLQCGHNWVPSVANPKCCPKCKSYKYREPKKPVEAAVEK